MTDQTELQLELIKMKHQLAEANSKVDELREALSQREGMAEQLIAQESRIAELNKQLSQRRMTREVMIDRLRRVDVLFHRMKKAVQLSARIFSSNDVSLDMDIFGSAVTALLFQDFEPGDIDVRVAIRGVNLRRSEMNSAIMQILRLIQSMDDKLTKIEEGNKTAYRDLNVYSIEYDGVPIDLLVEKEYSVSPEANVTGLILDSQCRIRSRLLVSGYNPIRHLLSLFHIANGKAKWMGPKPDHLRNFDLYFLKRLEKLVNKGFQVNYFFLSGALNPLTCPICRETGRNLVLTCGHTICIGCAQESIRHRNFRCSMCRGETKLLLQEQGLGDIPDGLREEISASYCEQAVDRSFYKKFIFSKN
jgi:uncharacterized coiled-coil protein SlyX